MTPTVSYALNKVLTAVARQHTMKPALSDPERAALKAGDIDALYRLGANPYLIRRVFRARFKI